MISCGGRSSPRTPGASARGGGVNGTGCNAGRDVEEGPRVAGFRTTRTARSAFSLEHAGGPGLYWANHEGSRRIQKDFDVFVAGLDI
jgi:hypothetical protein